MMTAPSRSVLKGMRWLRKYSIARSMSLDSGCGESYSEQGVMENAGFLDYRMPVALDLPMIEPLVVEVPNPKHPYGVRGVGENAIVAPRRRWPTARSRPAGWSLPPPPEPGCDVNLTTLDTSPQVAALAPIRRPECRSQRERQAEPEVTRVAFHPPALSPTNTVRIFSIR